VTPLPSPSPTPTTFGAGVITFSILLSTITWLPVIMALVIAITPESRRRGQRRLMGIAFWTNVFLLGLTLIVYGGQFSIYGSGLQFEEKLPWMPPLGVSYHLGISGIGMLMLLLSGLVGVVVTLAAFDLRDRARPFFVLLLLAQGAINGAICAQNLLVLVLFWAGATVPLALLVAGWSGSRRWRAAAALSAYWTLGSAALLVAGLLLSLSFGGTSLELSDLSQARPGTGVQIAAAILIAIAAASRLPLVPLHGWAREALAESHPAVGMLVAGSATRLGGVVLLEMFAGANPDGARRVAPALAALAVLTVAYGALAAFRTQDLRRATAYLAVVPGALTALGVAGLTPLSLDGAAVFLFAGGVAAALMVGTGAFLAQRAQTRSLAVAAGLGPRMPKLAWLLLAAAAGILGLPLLASFPALLMTFLGAFHNQPAAVLLAAVALLLTAAAIAWLLRRALFGPPHPEAPVPGDASLSETWCLGILVGALLWVGLLPNGPKLAGNPFFDPGLVNVSTQASSDLSSSYAPPAPPSPAASATPAPSSSSSP
jgi:NAD(P)H-quinone oxidoreductase subunit 4